jgi:tRNA-specific adenosine deaminase 1
MTTTDSGQDPDAIADAVLEAFDKLPPKCKPRPRSDGEREWIPLAGIVIAKVKMGNWNVSL